MNQPIFERITKLLKLAQRGTGPEAELALMKAQQLATEHQVDLATVNTAEGETVQKEVFDEGVAEATRDNLTWFIIWLLQKHFRVKAVVWNDQARFVGRKSDTVFAVYLFSWLREHFINEWNKEQKKPGLENGRRRTSKSFWYGMYLGLNEKLSETKKKTEGLSIIAVAFNQQPRDGSVSADEMVQQVEGKYQLAIVEEADELEKEYNRLHPNVSRRSRSMNMGSMNAVSAGRAAGARTRLPGLPLNSSSRSALS